MTALVQDKVAIVTGGAKGLGHGISRCLAREGAHLLITGRDGAAAEAVAAEISAEFGVRAVGMSADVGVKADVEAMIDRAVAEFGGIDILVNNASLLSDNVLLEQKTDEMLKRTLEIGTWGSWWAMRAAFPHMKARGGGSIVNIASVSARLGLPNAMVYCGIKAAVEGMTRSSAIELAPAGIRVNSVGPSTVATEGVKAMLDEATFAARVASTPLGRLGETADIAEAVLFLADPARSGFVTGQSLLVDGGISIALR